MKQDDTNNTDQQVTDDQDLAQVLANANNSSSNSGLQFEAAPAPGEAAVPPSLPEPEAPLTPPVEEAAQTVDESALSAALDEAVHSLPEPTPAAQPLTDMSAAHGTTHTSSPELDEIKKNALEELRPLVDKLNLQPDEKFDTLLLIIRSTDDKALLGPAHQAAKAIEDDSRRAQALLDVIKEIDYFSNQAAV